MGVKKQIYGNSSFNPLEDLKKIIERKGEKILRKPAPTKPAQIIKDKEVSDEELLAAAMKEVREIKDFRQMPMHNKKPPPVPKICLPEEESVRALEEIVVGHRPINLPDTQEYVEWINNGYRVSIIKKMRNGHFAVRDSLDLHGLTLEEAEEAVDIFLKESIKKGYQCVKIIHGRGLRSPHGPVLKEALVRSLSGRYRKYVVAFVTARQCDGGLGAVYVLLK